MSKKPKIQKSKNTESKEQAPKVAKELDINQIITWSKKYINPFELPNMVKDLDGVGSFKESYSIVAFFQLVQILSVVLGYFVVFLLSMPSLSASDLLSIVVQLVLSTILGVIIFYFSSWLLHFIAKIFGGKADFGNQTYVLSVLGLCHRVVFFVILVFIYPSMIGSLPILLSGVAVLAMFVISFYSWYVQFQVVQQLNKFSIWKSLGVLIIFLILSAMIMSIFSYLLLGEAAAI